MRIGFTGTRLGMTARQRSLLLGQLVLWPQSFEFHSGDCVGADQEAHELVQQFASEASTFGHPPDNSALRAFCRYDFEYQPAPYLVRDHRIVDCTDFLVAAPRSLQAETRSGTWATVQYARRKGKRVYILAP